MWVDGGHARRQTSRWRPEHPYNVEDYRMKLETESFYQTLSTDTPGGRSSMTPKSSSACPEL